MKSNDSRIVTALFLSFAFCAMVFLPTEVAGGVPQANTNSAKVISPAQKNAASVTEQHARLLRDGGSAAVATLGARTELRADISKGHPQPALQAKPIPALAPPSFSALQRASIPESQNASSLYPAEINSAVPFNDESADSSLRQRTPHNGFNSASNAAAVSVLGAANVEPENTGSAQVFLVIVALCAALAGTAVVLYVIAKRSPGKEIVTEAIQANIQKARPQMTAPLRPETVQLEKSDAGVQLEETTEEENPVVELAQRYQRGQGEMQLLFSIQAHETDETPLANLLHASPSSKVRGKTVKLAKEIGLGKSEVDLLLRLQKCGASADHSVRIL